MSQSHDHAEGTPEELTAFLLRHPNQRFRLIPLSSDEQAISLKNIMIRKGMFPELGGLTEDIFKDAEWRDKRAQI